MKKVIFIIICTVMSFSSFAQTNKLTVNAGLLLPGTMNASVGFEHGFSYGSAVEVFGELGYNWQKTDPERYRDGGLVYKHRIARYKNGMLRLRFGPLFGAVQKEFFLGVEGGFEYNYVFGNGYELSVIQKNNVNFLHGDTFRNGLLIGMKIPF